MTGILSSPLNNFSIPTENNLLLLSLSFFLLNFMPLLLPCTSFSSTTGSPILTVKLLLKHWDFFVAVYATHIEYLQIMSNE